MRSEISLNLSRFVCTVDLETDLCHGRECLIVTCTNVHSENKSMFHFSVEILLELNNHPGETINSRFISIHQPMNQFMLPD